MFTPWVSFIGTSKIKNLELSLKDKCVDQKAFIPIFNTSFSTTNNHCEFTTRTDKFKELFCTKKKTVLRAGFVDF